MVVNLINSHLLNIKDDAIGLSSVIVIDELLWINGDNKYSTII